MILTLAVMHGIFFRHSLFFPVDDAYITLHNAGVLLSGTDINYPKISALSGTTSLIHLAVVSSLMLLVPPLWALWVAAWVGVFLYVSGILFLCFVWKARPWQAGLLVFIGLILGLMPLQLLNGLETGLTIASVTFALALASERSPRFPWLLPIVCAQLPFLRPELVVISVLLIFSRLAQKWQDNPSRASKQMAMDLFFLLLGALPWISWYFLTLGSIFPSTISAKKFFFAEGLLPETTKIKWTLGSLKLFAQTMGFFSLSAIGLLFSWPGRAGILFFIAFISAYYIFFPGALGHYEQRYLYVFIPFLFLGILPFWNKQNRATRLLVTGFLIIGLMESSLAFSGRWHYYEKTLDFTQQELKGVADWCQANLSPRSVLLVHDTGYIAYGTSFRLVDFVGLKTPESVPFHRQITWPSGGRDRHRAVSQIAKNSHAQYLIMLRGWDAIFHLSNSLKNLGWGLTPIRSSGEYQVYLLDEPIRKKMTKKN